MDDKIVELTTKLDKALVAIARLEQMVTTLFANQKENEELLFNHQEAMLLSDADISMASEMEEEVADIVGELGSPKREGPARQAKATRA